MVNLEEQGLVTYAPDHDKWYYRGHDYPAQRVGIRSVGSRPTRELPPPERRLTGVEKAEGADWDLKDSGGGSWSLGEAPYIKFTYGTPSGGQAIVATYKFYIPVRFQDDDLLRRTMARHQASTGALSTFFLDALEVRQDFSGSHLVTVPTP